MTATPGRLVLVGTPLGNREDWTPRARRALLEADLLLCEDTRSVLRLFDGETGLPPRQSCFAANEQDRIPLLLDRLGRGQTVAYVSEAGMPVWSDPGRELVDAAVAAGYEIDVVPGPTAAATALCHSGFSARGARFAGFPPRDGGARRSFIAAIDEEVAASIVYESGGRTPALLRDLAQVAEASTRRAIVARELTKAHQEVLRGTLTELAERITEGLRGEVTVVVEGRSAVPLDPAREAARATLEVLLATDLRPREKAKRLAQLTGLDTNSLYRRLESDT